MDGTIYSPATPEELVEAGYKPVIDTPYPDDGNTYAHSWQDNPADITGVWTLVHELTPEERRELAYQTEPCCEYDGKTYTCDGLEDLFYKYFAETGKEDKCAEIKAVITAGKAHIREEYPDVPEEVEEAE